MPIETDAPLSPPPAETDDRVPPVVALSSLIALVRVDEIVYYPCDATVHAAALSMMAFLSSDSEARKYH